MAYDPKTGVFKPEDESVSGRVTNLMSQSNPLMQQARTQGAQAANRRGLLNSSMGVQAGQAAAYGAALPIASQEASQAHQTNIQGRDLQTRDLMQKREITSQEGMHKRGIESSERIANLNRESQERIAQMNVAAHEREKAASLAAAFESNYAHVIAQVMNNHEIPANVRQQFLDHAGRMRDSNLRLVEQMYNIQLDWGQTPGTTTTQQPTGLVASILNSGLFRR